jgi:hypothetical protein
MKITRFFKQILYKQAEKPESELPRPYWNPCIERCAYKRNDYHRFYNGTQPAARMRPSDVVYATHIGIV